MQDTEAKPSRGSPRKRHAKLAKALALESPYKRQALSADLTKNWETSHLDSHVCVQLDHHSTLLLVTPQRDDYVDFTVIGHLRLWPLLGQPVRISGVPVTWEKANELGGISLFSPQSHALQRISVESHKSKVPLNTRKLARRICQCIGDVPADEERKLESRLAELLRDQPVQCAILCCRDPSLVCDVLRVMPNFESLFGQRSINGFHLQLSHDGSGQFDPEGLTEAVEEVMQLYHKDPSAAVVVIGGKSTGKSTSVRHLLNTLLLSERMDIDAVALLDCDPGQTEFTPPAFVSVTRVRQPLFGPPFSHADVTPISQCFVGSLSPAANPELYLRCVQKVYDSWVAERGEGRCPLLVNTMGWPQGLGRLLLVDILRMVRPRMVLQLSSMKEHDNFVDPVTANHVNSEDGWLETDQSIDLDYRLNHVTKPLSAPTRRSLAPPQHRDMTLTAHLALMLPPHHLPQYSPVLDGPLGGRDLLFCLRAAPPRRLPWSQVAFHAVTADCAIDPALLLLAVNAALVALARLDDGQWQELVLPDTPEDQPRALRRTPCCESLGIALVRGVDPATRELLLVSALPDEALAGVNCLLRGAPDLPAGVWQAGLADAAATPYCDLTVNSGVGRTGIRRERAHLKVRKKPQ